MGEQQGNTEVTIPAINEDAADLTDAFNMTDKEAEAKFIDWYEEICKERINMSEAEAKMKEQIEELEDSEARYTRRIAELEANERELLKAFEEVQSEVRMLRAKYESHSADDIAESYEVVVKEKVKLVETERQNKERIQLLENEVNLLRNYVKEFESLHEIKEVKKSRKEKGLVVITNSERLDDLEKENMHLKHVNKQLERERDTLNTQFNLLQAKMKSPENPFRVKIARPVIKVQGKFEVNKKCVPTFLPRLNATQSQSSGASGVSSGSYGRSPIPRDGGSRLGLTFGLGYGELHSIKQSMSSDDSSHADSAYRSIYKYMF